jgi:hypothetical protein
MGPTVSVIASKVVGVARVFVDLLFACPAFGVRRLDLQNWFHDPPFTMCMFLVQPVHLRPSACIIPPSVKVV